MGQLRPLLGGAGPAPAGSLLVPRGWRGELGRGPTHSGTAGEGEEGEREARPPSALSAHTVPAQQEPRPPPRARLLPPFRASSRAGVIEASSHDSCFHLAAFQVGQAGAGEAGTPAHVRLARNADLPAACRALGRTQSQAKGRRTAEREARGTGSPSGSTDTEVPDTSEPPPARPGLSPPRHDCHFLLGRGGRSFLVVGVGGRGAVLCVKERFTACLASLYSRDAGHAPYCEKQKSLQISRNVLVDAGRGSPVESHRSRPPYS